MDDPTTERLLHDDEEWDRFVTTRPNPSIAQLTAWAHANVHTGWGSTRVVTTTGSGCVGAQLLLHRMHPGHWQRGYVPHGPVGMRTDCLQPFIVRWGHTSHELSIRLAIAAVNAGFERVMYAAVA